MKTRRNGLSKMVLTLGLATGLLASSSLFALDTTTQIAAAETSKKESSVKESIVPKKADGEFDSLCVMGLAEGKRIKTDCSVNTVFEGKTYCFRAEDAKTAFNKDPKRNLERAKDHFAAGEVTQTGDDMSKYSVDDVKTWIDKHIQDEAKKNNGIYFVHDSSTGEKLALKYKNIDFMRTLHGYGFFPEAIFVAKDDPNKKYLIDFWVKPKGGQLDLFDVRIYKSPKKDGANWTLVKRQPKPWWWIPASEHPGESEQKRSWEVMSAIEEHIVSSKQATGLYKLTDDKTGKEVELEFIGVHQPVRKLKEGGQFFACTDFRRQGSKDEIYDIDFWLDEKTGKVKVNSVRVHKVPEMRDGDIIQVPRYNHDPSKTELVP